MTHRNDRNKAQREKPQTMQKGGRRRRKCGDKGEKCGDRQHGAGTSEWSARPGVGLPADSQQAGRTGAEPLRASPGTAAEAPPEGTGPCCGTDRRGQRSRLETRSSSLRGGGGGRPHVLYGRLAGRPLGFDQTSAT